MKIKVWTFNLRVDAAVDGINRFPYRKDRIFGVIKENRPDIIGFQEVNDGMREWLLSVLPEIGYSLIGVGRSSDNSGESVTVAFLNSKLTLLSCESKWLSNTPSVPGSTFGLDQSHCPRLFTSAVLKPKEGAPFLFLNTHLDHKGAIARLLGASHTVSYVAEKGMPFVITGDMNARPDAPEIGLFTSFETCGRPSIDATLELGGTFHAFGKKEEKPKIDYIFTNLPCDISESKIIPDEPVSGVYISDHYPVEATVKTLE